MTAFDELEGSKHTDTEILQRFLEEDDGREFVMVNLVQLHQDNIPHPVSGDKMKATDVIVEYFSPFILSLLRRGGHPVFQARRTGGNVDSWNADENLGFSVIGMMRYKSRRDLVELVMDPAFSDAHIYKLAAIKRTISYPAHMLMSTSVKPAIAIFLLLLLLASIVQNIASVLRP